MEQEHLVDVPAICFHCGDALPAVGGIPHDGKQFCCAGCKAVYDILSTHELCDYYTLGPSAGRTAKPREAQRFAFLDDPRLAKELTEFSDGTTATATFRIPQMHCSSCIWLLERLQTIDPGILSSRADFLRKELRVHYSETRTSLRNVVELLSSLGYCPELSGDRQRSRNDASSRRSLYYKIGIAGFSFSNIMLLSFPEYLSSGEVDPTLATVFRIVSIALALPVFLYSAWDYFRLSVAGLRRKMVTLDVPIALGILILFVRSVVDIAGGTGTGYLDSMTGLVFFLLIGKLVQTRTYERLNFERDYRSFFPLSVTVLRSSEELTVPAADLKIGDRMIVRNGEIVPADAVLIRGAGEIDYSFVTGEARAVRAGAGTLVLAGGRQTGAAIELEAVREVSQGYLTQLWNTLPLPDGREGRMTAFAHAVAGYFTAGVLLLAGIAALVWLPADAVKAMHAVTAVLIVACPCALALAPPFAFGAAQRIMGKHGFYLKNSGVVERLATADAAVFDKTGTITSTAQTVVAYEGIPLSGAERRAAGALAASSYHPLSRAIASWCRARFGEPLERMEEFPGEGLRGNAGGVAVALGRYGFVTGSEEGEPDATGGETRVHCAVRGAYRGFFVVGSRYRESIDSLFSALGQRMALGVASGDADAERSLLVTKLGPRAEMRFRQSPAQKMEFVRHLQRQGRNVLMVGDGLNDAGALRQSDAGIAVTDNVAAFSPGCDAILEGSKLALLPEFLECARFSRGVVIASFVLSLAYNAVGLWYAFQGSLSPLVAAVLMPASSLTVVSFCVGALHLWARRRRIA